MRYRTGDQIQANKRYSTCKLLPCTHCEILVTEYYFIRPELNTKDILCNACKLKSVPPRLQLKRYSDYLWNITQNRFEEHFALEDFYRCGWFLREQAVTTPYALQKEAINYTLEHYGEMTCVRFLDYPFYYGGMMECVTSKCRDTYIKCSI
jgi:hypothetical protein